jgi:hypothetical protein
MKINDSVRMTVVAFNFIYSNKPFFPFTPSDVGYVTAVTYTKDGRLVTVHYKNGFATYLDNELELVNANT